MTTNERARQIVSALQIFTREEDAIRYVAAQLEDLRLRSEKAGLDQGVQALRELQPAE